MRKTKGHSVKLLCLEQTHHTITDLISELVDLFLIDIFINFTLFYNTPHLECII